MSVMVCSTYSVSFLSISLLIVWVQETYHNTECTMVCLVLQSVFLNPSHIYERDDYMLKFMLTEVHIWPFCNATAMKMIFCISVFCGCHNGDHLSLSAQNLNFLTNKRRGSWSCPRRWFVNPCEKLSPKSFEQKFSSLPGTQT